MLSSYKLTSGFVENADISDIADFFPPTFINPCFRNIKNLDFKNPRFSNIPLSIFTYSEHHIENLDYKIFKHPLFREYRKHGCLKSRIFEIQVFDIH